MHASTFFFLVKVDGRRVELMGWGLEGSGMEWKGGEGRGRMVCG